jgi:hypothetical protein
MIGIGHPRLALVRKRSFSSQPGCKPQDKNCDSDWNLRNQLV